MRRMKPKNKNKDNMILIRCNSELKKAIAKLVKLHHIDGLGSESAAGRALFEAWVDGRIVYKNRRIEAAKGD